MYRETKGKGGGCCSFLVVPLILFAIFAFISIVGMSH